MNRFRLIEDLERDEGVRLKPYKDTVGKWRRGKIEAKDGAIAARRPSNHQPDYEGVTAMAVFHSDASEVWRPIGGFENYEVSSMGRVRQLGRVCQRERNGRIHTVNINPKILSGWLKRKNGAPMCRLVSLRRDGETHIFRIHRLVLEAFVGQPPAGMEGCHNNGNPEDNRLANLRWDTHEENFRDAVWHGTASRPPIHRGESHPASKVSDAELAEFRAIPYRHGLYAHYARKWGMASASVGRLHRRESRA